MSGPVVDTKTVQKEPKGFSSSKDKKPAIDKSSSSQDKIGRLKIDKDFEVNKEDPYEIQLEDSDKEQNEGGEKSGKGKASKPKEEKKSGGGLAGLKGKFGNALSGLKSSGNSGPKAPVEEDSDQLWQEYDDDGFSFF